MYWLFLTVHLSQCCMRKNFRWTRVNSGLAKSKENFLREVFLWHLLTEYSITKGRQGRGQSWWELFQWRSSPSRRSGSLPACSTGLMCHAPDSPLKVLSHKICEIIFFWKLKQYFLYRRYGYFCWSFGDSSIIPWVYTSTCSKLMVILTHTRKDTVYIIIMWSFRKKGEQF